MTGIEEVRYVVSFEPILRLLQNLPFLTLFFPLLGSTLVFLFKQERLARAFTLAVTILTLIPLGFMLAWFDYNLNTGFQFLVVQPFLPSVGVSLAFGVDHLSLFLGALTGILFVVAAIGSYSIPEGKSVHLYCFLFLLLEASILGVFFALDFVIFFIFWELMLLPMLFLIGIWGGPRRIYAAIKFFLYTMAGSVLILIGMAVLYVYSRGASPTGTFFIPALWGVGPTVPPVLQELLFWFFFLGFGVKVPIVPLHTWLPDAHVEAPTPISVILAGILLKTGGYGFYRILFPTLPEMCVRYGLLIGIVGVVMIVYAALVAMAQADMKTLIANASISHMGYVLFGLATFTPIGWVAGMFMMISHGFVSGALFLLSGVIYDRAHTRIIAEFGGLGSIMRKYYFFFALVGMANLALPPLSGFWGELLAYLGAFSNTSPRFLLPNGWYALRILALFALPGIVITAGYTLWLLERVFMGPLNERWKDLRDMDYREVLSLAIPSFFIVLLGIMPALIANPLHGRLAVLLGVFQPLLSGP